MTLTPTQSAPCIELVHGDALTVMADLPSEAFELIFCDLPYGSTRCQWDKRIPMAPLWEQLERILTPTGTIVMTAAQPFTTDLIVAGRHLFKYSLVWQKSRPSQFVHSANRPLSDHEDILVFSKGTVMHAARSQRRMTYNALGAEDDGTRLHRRQKSRAMGNTNPAKLGMPYKARKNLPRSVQFHANPYKPRHETQKPESLMEWIIGTYSNAGDLVLDPTMGSGTTGVAAIRQGRGFFGIECGEEYFDYAEARILDELSNSRPSTLPPAPAAALAVPSPDNDDSEEQSDAA
ncbi:DNA-methyltransferase [Sphingomonas sanguinis]|uniref:DNA-methyltransferase n=1 Tax=Sphingomonas sanguinis TaxID=33051 RepID=UPI0007370B64|nr:site-specific DNA-methyltransferase [Sphingomonas sanguinis]